MKQLRIKVVQYNMTTYRRLVLRPHKMIELSRGAGSRTRLGDENLQPHHTPPPFAAKGQANNVFSRQLYCL